MNWQGNIFREENCMDLSFLAPAGAVLALLFAAINALNVCKKEMGSEKLKTLSGYIKKGANAYRCV